ncbi:MAG TPA: hypothetical protein VFI27_16295 [candidate division Zixibacteria bacterium]|nr:hypothetical protein [candidate division Zixibacteria bacterium]
MDHIHILKRSWHNVTRYKALWIFGILLALTTFSGETFLLFGDSDSAQEPVFQYQLSERDREWLRDTFDLEFSESFTLSGGEAAEFFQNTVAQTVLAIVILVIFVIFILILLSLLVRYLSETAVIKMVNDYEKTGTKYGIRQGLRMAWSRSAWRLFLIDLTVRLPAVLLLLVLIVMVVAPIFAFASTGTVAGIAGAVATGGLFLLLLALAIVAGIVLGVLARVARQACVVDNLGVLESIRRGYEIVRYNLKDVGIMWLVMLGINLTWPLLMIPVVIVLVGIGVIVAGVVVGLIGGLTALATAGTAAWVAAGVVGVILFLLMLVAPLALLTGMRVIFESSAWTLTYRDLRSMGQLKVQEAPKPAAV